MKKQELKELQDKSLKISMQDWLSGKVSSEDMKKLTHKEKSDLFGNIMVSNINDNVLARGEESDRIRGADGKFMDDEALSNP